MKKRPGPPDAATQARLAGELRREREKREAGYRERALRLLPHVCASCGREFSGTRLRELTVHHRDHDWKNNPPDGSNWELLCLYCHDHEHEKFRLAGHFSGSVSDAGHGTTGAFQPFAGLDSLVRPAVAPAGDASTPADGAKSGDAPGLPG